MTDADYALMVDIRKLETSARARGYAEGRADGFAACREIAAHIARDNPHIPHVCVAETILSLHDVAAEQPPDADKLHAEQLVKANEVGGIPGDW